MARTKTTTRSYLDRIIEIRRVIVPALSQEVADLSKKLGTGTWRSRNHPGLKVQVSSPRIQTGNTSWKDVCADLQVQYNIPDDVIKRLARKHKSAPCRVSATYRTTVAKDTSLNSLREAI